MPPSVRHPGLLLGEAALPMERVQMPMQRLRGSQEEWEPEGCGQTDFGDSQGSLGGQPRRPEPE